MYATAALWTFKAETVDEALYAHKSKVMPVLQAQPGYVRSVLVRTGPDSLLSLVCWATEDEAKSALAEVAPLLVRHLGHLVRGVERHPGPVMAEGYAPKHRNARNGAAHAPSLIGRLRLAVHPGRISTRS